MSLELHRIIRSNLDLGKDSLGGEVAIATGEQRKKEKRGKENRGRALGTKARNHRERRDEPKTPSVEEVAGIVIGAPGTPAIPRKVVPATAAEHSHIAITCTFPRTSVSRCSIIIIVPSI